MRKYLIVFEKTKNGYSAYSPDLEGCVATGTTKKEAEKNMYAALEMHIKGILEDKNQLPEATSSSEYILFNEKTFTTS